MRGWNTLLHTDDLQVDLANICDVVPAWNTVFFIGQKRGFIEPFIHHRCSRPTKHKHLSFYTMPLWHQGKEAAWEALVLSFPLLLPPHSPPHLQERGCHQPGPPPAPWPAMPKTKDPDHIPFAKTHIIPQGYFFLFSGCCVVLTSKGGREQSVCLILKNTIFSLCSNGGECRQTFSSTVQYLLQDLNSAGKGLFFIRAAMRCLGYACWVRSGACSGEVSCNSARTWITESQNVRGWKGALWVI